MSHLIQALTPQGEVIDDLNISGDLSAFYAYFGARELDMGSNGDGAFTVTVEGVKNFLQTENKHPAPNSGESLLRGFLANLAETSVDTNFIIDCQ